MTFTEVTIGSNNEMLGVLIGYCSAETNLLHMQSL